MKTLFDDQYMQKKLNELTKDEIKTLGRDVAEIDHLNNEMKRL